MRATPSSLKHSYPTPKEHPHDRSHRPRRDLRVSSPRPEILRVVNVWDVVSARAIADLPQTRALATAGHSIAATFGYEDGENIPLDLMLDMVGRIVAAVDVPVSADLDAGYGDPGETVRRAIGVGVVGANVEDRLRPLADSVAAVEAIVAAGAAEGVPFVLNARTDAVLKGGDRPSTRSSRMPSPAAARTSTPEPRPCSSRASWTRTRRVAWSRASANGR